MFCKFCGNKVGEYDEFCESCGKKILDSPMECNFKKVEDNPSHYAGVVSCCFPVVGLVLYFLWRDEKPESSKLICYWMIAGLVVWIIVYFIALISGYSTSYSIRFNY